MPFVERVFSGVQPTGNLHLGNYLGAIVNFVKMQETHNCIYCVVDMHAITQGVDVWGGPVELARNTREVTAAFIASGIDPSKHIVFNQSQVSGHAELAWIFNCVARMGWYSRPYDPVQGEGRQGPRERLRRSVRLSRADGG
ncbi:tryptophanyl-tRNA synthetase [Bradyrhizobium sp. GM0.4]